MTNNKKKSDQSFFINLDQIKLPKSVENMPRILVYFFSILAVVLVVIPWQQTSKGTGYVLASDPNDRAQNITAPIEGRIKKWYVQDGSMVKEGDKLVEIVDNDPLILDRLVADRDAKKRKYEVAKIASETSQLNYQRQEDLFKKGLSSKRDFEESKIEYKKLLSAVESATSELAEVEIKLSRQQNQIIYAPKNGIILKVLAGDSATLVKSGDKLATFAPKLTDPIIELYVGGNDIPLINIGRKVRLQFEGWPIVQFSGWPSVAIGTFGGEVYSVDSSVSENGKFRILIKKPEDEKWPEYKFLRHGAKAYGWVLLNKVSLGYEIWRQINSFPPNFDSDIEHKKNHHE
jgi:multidrug resistance efflux pump